MLRSWTLKMEISKTTGLAVYMQIAQKIVEEIQLGRLPSSTAMPGTRELALSLDVNRKTVVLAYAELVAQGWLSTEPRRGTFVSADLPNFSSTSNSAARHAVDSHAPVVTPQTPHTKHDGRPVVDNMIDFNEGTPDTRMIPFEVLSRAFRRALAMSSRANQLGYSDPKGILPIRKSIATMLNMERGLHVDTENICMVRGSQMGIFVAARVLVQPKDYVVVERLTYLPARDAFKSCGANILDVGTDDHGIKVDELEKLCKVHQIRAVYVTPHHQFPTTVMMTADRRMRLLMLAEQYDFSIIEDDYDHEFHFSHNPVFPLSSADRSNRVIYVGSLSKVLAPGLRTGYLVASHEFIEQCAAEVMLIDRQGNPATELAVSELMNSGELKRHIRRTFKVYRERRDVLESLIRSELHSFVDFELPHGGLAFWLRFKQNITVDGLIERAYDNKVRIQPCSLFSEANEGVRGIRLGFGSLNKAEITEGIQRLKNAFSVVLLPLISFGFMDIEFCIGVAQLSGYA